MSDEGLCELAACYGAILPEDLSIERKNVLAAAFAGVQINIPIEKVLKQPGQYGAFLLWIRKFCCCYYFIRQTMMFYTVVFV